MRVDRLLSLRTIYRDIEEISEAGIPIASSSRKGGGYYIMDSNSISSLLLDRDEAHTFVAVIASDGRKILFLQKKTIFCLPEAAAFPAAASLTFSKYGCSCEPSSADLRKHGL
jgi:hypothetical protein